MSARVPFEPGLWFFHVGWVTDFFKAGSENTGVEGTEIDSFRFVRVFDQKQVKEIIKSCVKIIVYVSCNINSFERDALILLNNGYEMEWLKPIDQFPNTNHLEIVSKFNMVNEQKTLKDK